jgi:hypothetical protein
MDIRNTEFKVAVRKSEDSMSAIERFMNKSGYSLSKKIDGKDLTHFYFTNNEYELWVSESSYSETTKKVTFKLTGNKYQEAK